MSTREPSRPVPVPVPVPVAVALATLSAIPLTAGTLRLIQPKGAGWVINLGVAKRTLRRPTRRRSTLLTGPQHAGALS